MRNYPCSENRTGEPFEARGSGFTVENGLLGGTGKIVILTRWPDDAADDGNKNKKEKVHVHKNKLTIFWLIFDKIQTKSLRVSCVLPYNQKKTSGIWKWFVVVILDIYL